MSDKELTTPIQDEKVIVLTEGEIVLRYQKSILLKIAKIRYERFENEEYQYSILPYYDVIDGLPLSIFQGLPGIDLSLRRPVYYRVNMIPVYVSERSPSENRVNLKSLLKQAGMTYYNRLEWMIRTNYYYMGDSFVTLRLDYPYKTEVRNKNSLSFLTSVLSLLGSREKIEIEGVLYQEKERPTLIKTYISQYQNLIARIRKNVVTGQEAGKKKGNYRGRKKIKIDVPLLNQLTEEGKTEKEIAAILQISRTTLYRYRKEN